ncbi:serine hydrolase [Candidatus Saccharibacteria bacterium]|nr:serine hydrolase [Candidatus Saccharibacteria bacterium]
MGTGFYESPRQRRLRLERERQAERRRKGAKLGIFLVVIAVVILGVMIWRAIAIAHDQANEQVRIEAEKLAEQKRIESSPTYKIQRDLPAKIAELNTQLGLPKKANPSDTPKTDAVSVALIDLSDKDRGRVNYNGDMEFTAASTYKLYVAYLMINAVETGKTKWTSGLNGTSLDQCFQIMILNSDNACPEAYLSQVGFSKANAQIHALGLSDRTQVVAYDMLTTANDLALFLQKLYKGELMNADNQAKLIDVMKRQIYRQGISAGILARNKTTGQTDSVANKVGFMNSLLHDAGIVYSEKGNYVLAIMTNGESWPFIAQLSTWIDEQITQ